MFFSFTLSPALISISLGIIAFLSILTFNKTQLNQNLVLNVLFVLFFISSFLSYFYSENSHEASRKLILKLPVFIAPLIFIALNKIDEKTKNIGILTLAYASYLPAVVSVYNYLSNKSLFDQLILESKPLPIEFGYGIYHIQFSIFLALSILFTFNQIIILHQNKNYNLLFYFLILLGVSNFVFIHILSARTGLLSLYVGLLAMIGLKFKLFNLKQKLIALILIILLPISIYFFSSSIQNRVQNTMTDFKVVWKGENANEYSFAMRVQAWKNSILTIKKHPLLGVGIGDAEKVLYDEFATNNPSIEPKNRRNPHFQFLESSVQSGLINGLLFLSIAIYLLIHSYRKSNIILFSVVISLLVSSCFESILERQTSLIAFVFFIGLALKKEK